MTQQEKIQTDIIGKRYGRLTVISYSHKEKKHGAGYNHYYNCKCDCGKYYIGERDRIKFGNTKSCGCIRSDMLTQWNVDNKGFTPHSEIEGHKRLYTIYNGMKNRCYTKSHKKYNLYGGRGIHICDEWLNSFKAFKDWALSNGYNDNLTIDRINVNGNYNPDNCRWASYETQANNTRSNKYIEYKGRVQTLSQWCKELNLNYDRVKARLNYLNMTIEEAFNNGLYMNNGKRTLK